jgi:hypothetical protein
MKGGYHDSKKSNARRDDPRFRITYSRIAFIASTTKLKKLMN